MRKFYRIAAAGLLLMLAFNSAWSQQRFFSNARPNGTVPTMGQRVIIPEKYSAVSFDMPSLKSFLWSLPAETQVIASRGEGQIIELPMPDGSSARFRVWESSIQEPALAAKFPDIKTFNGQGIDDRAATIRMDYSPDNGFHAQILSPEGRIYVDPYARGDVNNYISYYARDYRKATSFSCGVTETDMVPQLAGRIGANCRGTELYTYRLAVACTGEYAQAVGATTPAQLHAAIVTTVNRVVGVYENEVAIRMVLVANNNLIEYLNPSTDQFTGNNNAGTLINESQTVINSIIGAANYDIGHTFSTGGGGLAGLRVVCNNASKARGITGSPQPFGDAYDIDYVAHEIGHQFGGNHTFNSSTSSCGGGNRNASTAYEVGSGTSIQAYAGICGTDNIQPNSDPFFHAISFDEISAFVEAGGASCRQATATNNNLPVITSMPVNGLFIPRGTPFTLTATATDADGDALTYSWEQFDLGPSTTWSGGANSATAPLFKSRIPKLSGSRTFPDMAVILANYPNNPPATLGGLKGETLPQVGRAMKFRVTVRDNRAGGGGVVSAGSGCDGGGFTGDFIVNTVDATGPFLVTAPNGGESYPGGSLQNITWNVAGTNVAPINVTNVKITMSTDGGATYPITLAASTANDGSEQLAIPVGLTSTARIKIEAIDNIFFDISNTNFSVTAPLDGFEFSQPAPASVACAGPTTAVINLGTTAFGSFNTPITLSASGNPAGTTVSFGTNPVTPGNSTTVTLNGTNTLQNGTYVVTITGTAGAQVRQRELTFTIQAGAAPVISAQPLDEAVCVGTDANFSVTASGASSYQWQVSTNGGNSFSNVATGGTGNAYTVSNVSSGLNNNEYRVQVIGQCNTTISNEVVLTAQEAPAISANPVSRTLCEGTNASFSVTATGTALTYTWQVSNDGGNNFTDIGSSNNSTYVVNNIAPAQNNNQYRVRINGTCAPTATSSAATLNVVVPAAVTADPVSIAECETGNVSFTVTGAGTGIIYAWQRSLDAGNSWQNVANGGVYTGATSNTLSLTNLPPDFNNHQYRALLSNSICTAPDISAAATLTVNPRPTVTLAATRLNLSPGQTSQITATILPDPGGFNITWLRNDNPIAGATGSSVTANVTTLGSYKATILNPVTGCNNESQVLTLNAEASTRLFIYPSPNNGQFTVSYFNSAWNNQRQTIAIYDSKGARVYYSVLNLTGPYTLHPINLAGSGSGVYYVVLGDGSGKKITEGKVLIAY